MFIFKTQQTFPRPVRPFYVFVLCSIICFSPRPPRNNAASPPLIICCKSQKWISPKIYMSKNSYPPYLPLDDSHVPIYMSFTQQMYLQHKNKLSKTNKLITQIIRCYYSQWTRLKITDIICNGVEIYKVEEISKMAGNKSNMEDLSLGKKVTPEAHRLETG